MTKSLKMNRRRVKSPYLFLLLKVVCTVCLLLNRICLAVCYLSVSLYLKAASVVSVDIAVLLNSLTPLND